MRQRGRNGWYVESFLWEWMLPLVQYSPLVNCLWLEGLWRVLGGILIYSEFVYAVMHYMLLDSYNLLLCVLAYTLNFAKIYNYIGLHVYCTTCVVV